MPKDDRSRPEMPRLNRPTVETISLQAGVSPSTVSRALKGDPRISAVTRNSVASIARQLGYLPNANARSLVTRRSGVVGFVMGDPGNPAYVDILERLVRSASNRSLRIMVLHVGQEALQESSVEAMLQYQIDGCIITSAELTSRAALICDQHRVPLVMMNRVPRVHGCAVSCNNQAGGRMVGELLLKGGHRRVALVAGASNTSTSSDREAGAVGALAAHGLTPFARLEGLSTYDGGFAAGEKLAIGPIRPDAIFAINDIMALGVIDAVRKHGLRIPDDISVVGFDDIPAASWPSYDLTTVAQPTEAMVERALDLLVARMDDPMAPGEEAYIMGEVRIRGSARISLNSSDGNPSTIASVQTA